MPGLVKRYHAGAAYAAQLSTNPSTRRALRDEEDYTPSSTRAAISDEAADWYEAVCPPLEEVQDVIRRFHADPDFSQERVFAFLAPIVIFGALFVVAVVAVQPHSFAHRILDNPESSTRDMLRLVGFLIGGIVLSAVTLKCAVWGIAEISSIILTMKTTEERRRRERSGAPPSNILGGIFM